jgi:transcription antitermination factor NusG
MPHARRSLDWQSGPNEYGTFCMPILPPDTTLHPPELLANGIPVGEDRCWWAVYTKARQEKSLARDLLRQSIPFFLPTIVKRSVVRGRRIRSQLPLFGGYLFLFAKEDERVQCLTTNRVSQLIPVHDQDQLQSDLRQVHRLIASDAPLTVESKLAPGRRVRIQSGSLMGLEGVVVARRGGDRLLVAVNFLQQGVSVALHDFLVEPID